jgi:hypothetical protein
MSFSAGFLAAIVYGSLAWCALAAIALAFLLVRDLFMGGVW